MLDEQNDSNVSWIGFSDLFFHLFIFFLIVFASVKISAVAKIEGDKGAVHELEAQVKLLNRQLDDCESEKAILEEKKAECEDNVTEIVWNVEELKKLLSACQKQKQIYFSELKVCRKNLDDCKSELNFCHKNLDNCKYKLQEYRDSGCYREGGQISITQILNNQKEVIEEINKKYSEITVKNNLHVQTISFGSGVLFESGNDMLKKHGEELLNGVGRILREKLNLIQEIQIQGHADTAPIINKTKFPSNLELAAGRAISVFHHLNSIGINPETTLMSATSFGEYKPVGRETSNGYNREQLETANDTKEKKERNRRIEIVLTYRR